MRPLSIMDKCRHTARLLICGLMRRSHTDENRIEVGVPVRPLSSTNKRDFGKDRKLEGPFNFS